MQSCGCPRLHTVLLRKTGKTCRHYRYFLIILTYYPGLLIKSGGRHSLARKVLGKIEYLNASILEYEMENRFLVNNAAFLHKIGYSRSKDNRGNTMHFSMPTF